MRGCVISSENVPSSFSYIIEIKIFAARSHDMSRVTAQPWKAMPISAMIPSRRPCDVGRRRSGRFYLRGIPWRVWRPDRVGPGWEGSRDLDPAWSRLLVLRRCCTDRISWIFPGGGIWASCPRRRKREGCQCCNTAKYVAVLQNVLQLWKDVFLICGLQLETLENVAA